MAGTSAQSYLILGSGNQRQKKIEELAVSLGLSQKQSSPDLTIITANPKKSAISIEDIRNLKNHIFHKPVAQKFKLVIIEEAEKLTVEAQNALLKILEEPPKTAVIILSAKDKTRLLPTILSRVVTVWTKSETHQSQNQSFLEKDLISALEEAVKSEDPSGWLDDQILILYQKLKQFKDSDNTQELEKSIRACAQAKEMIEANVNPQHVLSSLILNTLDR